MNEQGMVTLVQVNRKDLLLDVDEFIKAPKEIEYIKFSLVFIISQGANPNARCDGRAVGQFP
jgi:hypothetical protein